MISFKKPALSDLSIWHEGNAFRYCKNYEKDTCNWMVPAESPDMYCAACSLNRTIPNLTDFQNIQKWRRLEVAKHRLVYQLQRFGLPLESKMQDPDTGLCFDFISKGNSSVMTGHANGVITILLSEADAVHREQIKRQMSERYRTLVGHFRHEVGHYYWDRVIKENEQLLAEFRELFGDERADYRESLKKHYEKGPPSGWRDNYISKYASTHPWEDWAETWAHYLHLMDTAETAYFYGFTIDPHLKDVNHMKTTIDYDPYLLRDFERLISSSTALFFAINSVNRSMGIPDVYPFILNTKVVGKMRFIHSVLFSEI